MCPKDSGAPSGRWFGSIRLGEEEPIPAPPRAYTLPRLSPDGTRVALDVRDQELDVWVWDLTRSTLTRLTFDPRLDRFPAWTPDGQRIAFSSDQAGVTNLFWRAADGTGAIERLSESPNLQYASSITPDGTKLIFQEAGNLLLLTLDEDRQVVPLLQTVTEARNGEISPDGRWLAYQSNESGQAQIYVQPFPEVNRGKWQVSTNGGTEPLWARNGQELFYRATDESVMGVRVSDEEGGFAWSTPVVVIEGKYFAGGNVYSGRTYDVAPDGDRFLMIPNISVGDDSSSQINVVLNWFEELKERVPVP